MIVLTFLLELRLRLESHNYRIQSVLYFLSFCSSVGLKFKRIPFLQKIIEIIVAFIPGWHSLDLTSGCPVTVINIFIYMYIYIYSKV